MKKRIFISYSHEDERWKNLLVTHLNVLEEQLEVWDDTRIQAGEQWEKEINAAMEDADAAILLVSADFLTSGFIKSVEVPALMQRRAKENMKIFPLILRPCAWDEIHWLKSMQVRPKEAVPLSTLSESAAETALTAFAKEIKNILNQKSPKETAEAAEEASGVAAADGPKPGDVFLSKLPAGGRVFLGREKELDMLHKAWEDTHTHVLTLVAWGGVGKTALVNRWLNDMEKDRFRGAARVYGWSFYSQGASVDRQTSADAFIDHALRWFGDPDPTTGSAWDKGTRLANRVRETKTLLVLDGLEPLQHPPGAMQGHLKDPALEALLKGLARSQPGLCVVTTRLKVEGIEFGADSPVRQECLDKLSPETGAALLKEHGVNGTDAELEAVSTEFKGHALALNLLGRYLAVVHGGDIRKKDRVPRLTDEEKEGGHAKRVMQAYEKLLSGKPELNVLYMLGLFDRPADAGAVNALRAKPWIKGLTKEIKRLSDAEWRYALAHLRDLNLLAVEEEAGGQEVLDSHPLVREYFGERFAHERPGSWKEAHDRLYEYYKGLPKEEHPETLREMEPLFIAVFHGCRADRHQEALDDVYWERIKRKEEYFITKKLGAFGSDLSALSGFFAVPWSRPSPGLTEGAQGFILNEAAVCLRALGRLREVAQPMEASLESYRAREDWRRAAMIASNLSELCLTLGEVSRAVEWARKSVALADKSGDAGWQYASRTTLADALHQSGTVGSDEVAEALTLFREAEEILKKEWSHYPFLFSLPGYRYCDLLLGGQEPGSYREVQKRAAQTLKWATEMKVLLDIALDNLSLGRAHWLQALDEGPSDFTVPLAVLDRAVDGLRESGNQDELPRGLLARAAVYRTMKSFSRAREDLEEAREIAERGSMGLHMADYHLESARLCRDMGDTETAKTHRETAKTQIAQMAYHRRDPEIEELEAAARPVFKIEPTEHTEDTEK